MKMLNILIVEDKYERIELLRALYHQQITTICRSAEDAMDLLRSRTYDLIQLDFDLDGNADGEDVARLLAEQESRALVIIHSENPEGKASIKVHLPHALAVPISLLRTKSEQVAHLKALLAQPNIIDVKLVTALLGTFDNVEPV